LVLRFVSHEEHIGGTIRLLQPLRNVRHPKLDYSEAVIPSRLGKQGILRLAETLTIDRLLQLRSDALG
jgi:hypothetical protein